MRDKRRSEQSVVLAALKLDRCERGTVVYGMALNDLHREIKRLRSILASLPTT